MASVRRPSARLGLAHRLNTAKYIFYLHSALTCLPVAADDASTVAHDYYFRNSRARSTITCAARMFVHFALPKFAASDVHLRHACRNQTDLLLAMLDSQSLLAH